MSNAQAHHEAEATSKEVVAGVHVEVSHDRQSTHPQSQWLIKQGNGGMRVDVARVTLSHPYVRASYYSSTDPLNDGNINLAWLRQYEQEHIEFGIAKALAVVLEEATALHEEIKEGLQSKAEQARELIRERERQREEERKKWQAEREARRARDQKKRELEAEWSREVFEALKWYEGQEGRFKRHRLKSWVIAKPITEVHEYGVRLLSERGEHYNLRFTELQKFQIKYADERTYSDVELPAYPQDNIDAIYAEES